VFLLFEAGADLFDEVVKIPSSHFFLSVGKSLIFSSPFHPFPQSFQSPLDMVDHDTTEGKACYDLVEKLTVSLPLFSPHLPLSSSENIPVALFPSWSLQSTRQQNPRPRPKSKAKTAEFIEEGA
jgi:hypothetical protein